MKLSRFQHFSFISTYNLQYKFIRNYNIINILNDI